MIASDADVCHNTTRARDTHAKKQTNNYNNMEKTNNTENAKEEW